MIESRYKGTKTRSLLSSFYPGSFTTNITILYYYALVYFLI
jgi:hypothetical protein